jgi:hypothetical protein
MTKFATFTSQSMAEQEDYSNQCLAMLKSLAVNSSQEADFSF